MANARQLVKRRKAVRNIRKITQTMQLIATARYQKCLQRATASKPYVDKLTEMIQTLAAMESVAHPLMQANEESKRIILLTATSNRGLCGAYNASVLRASTLKHKALLKEGFDVDMEMIGKKGVNYCRFLQIPLSEIITDIEDKVAYARVADMANRFMELYEAGEVAKVFVAYTRFNSVSSQVPTIAQLLPIEPPKVSEGGGPNVEFEFSPAPDQLLARLIPETVKIRLYQYLNDAIVSEQVARMVAMKAATDAAGDMIKSLSRQYNRARQTQITLELADIVGGANAIEA